MDRPVLVVEDNSGDLELLQVALDFCNTRQPVVSVDDGQKALDYMTRTGEYASCTHKEPDLILLDIKMPRGTGLEVLEVIKADPRLRRIPVIALTSSREDSDIARAYVLGINGYVVKVPITANFAAILPRSARGGAI